MPPRHGGRTLRASLLLALSCSRLPASRSLLVPPFTCVAFLQPCSVSVPESRAHTVRERPLCVSQRDWEGRGSVRWIPRSNTATARFTANSCRISDAAEVLKRLQNVVPDPRSDFSARASRPRRQPRSRSPSRPSTSLLSLSLSLAFTELVKMASHLASMAATAYAKEQVRHLLAQFRRRPSRPHLRSLRGDSLVFRGIASPAEPLAAISRYQPCRHTR